MSTGYDVTPVEEVKESFFCPHCRLLLRLAVQNHEGFRLCHDCCEEIRKMPNSHCKDCGMSIPVDSEVYPDKAARREISALQVYCPHRNTGCEWVGPLSMVEGHAAECRHKGVTCPNPGCGLVITTALLDQHLEECSHREVKCRHCNTSVQFCQLATHYEKECQQYPQPCKQCGKPVTRRDLKKHTEEACTLVKCRVCQEMVDRETTKDQVNGRNGNPHLSTPKTTFHHMQQVAKNNELISDKLTMLETVVQQLMNDYVPISRFSEVEHRLGTAVTALNTTKDDDVITGMKALLQEMQRTISSQNRKIEGQAREITKLSSQVESQAVVKGPSSHTVLQREEYTMTTGQSTRNYLTSEPSSNMEGMLMQITKSVEELQRTTSMMKVHISELELQLQASLASTHTGSFLWRIPEVARRKRDAFDGRITSIYSPPFYSGRNGYKMCIRAYLNGDGIGFNTHLSVFFVVMRGEYDQLLKWPFESKISLILVDQNLRQHIVQTFKPSPDSSSFQKPRSDMNVASGCPQFAKLSVLEEGNYVKNDVLFLKCIVDTAKITHP